MVNLSPLLQGRIDKLVQSKSNNKYNYNNIRKICFTINCIIVYLNNCHIDIKYSEIIDNK